MPTEFTGMRSIDGKTVAHDDYETCVECKARIPYNAAKRKAHLRTHEAHPDGYSEPPEPRTNLIEWLKANGSTDAEGYYRVKASSLAAAVARIPVSGYSESGERDRNGAASALALAIHAQHPDQQSYTDADCMTNDALDALGMVFTLDANPKAAATLAAYLRGASPSPNPDLLEAVKLFLESHDVKEASQAHCSQLCYHVIKLRKAFKND